MCYLVHVYFAFENHHHWSHLEAFESTRVETLAQTGIDSGFGLYVNYLFSLVWLVDTIYWWFVGDEAYSKRAWRWSISLHIFFLFMIFNGAIVFATGPARWIGAVVFLVGILCLAKTTNGRRNELSTKVE